MCRVGSQNKFKKNERSLVEYLDSVNWPHIRSPIRERHPTSDMGNRSSRKLLDKGNDPDASDTSALVAPPGDRFSGAPPSYNNGRTEDMIEGMKVRLQAAECSPDMIRDRVDPEFHLLLVAKIVRIDDRFPNTAEKEAILRYVLAHYDGVLHCQFVWTSDTEGSWRSKSECVRQ